MFKFRQEASTTVAEERLYLTTDKKRVVKEGDKEAAFLLAAKGQPIPASHVHLVKEEKKTVGVEPERRSTRPRNPDSTR